MVVERGANVTPVEAPIPAESRGDLRPWLAFSACSAIWGSTFLVISIGNDALAPVWAATLRLVLATVLLGLLTGTWECTSHGGPHGDETPFTLELEQNGEKVTGSVSSPQGGMEITSATFRNDVLEIHLDTPDGNYVLTAKLKDGQLSGQTSHDGNPAGKWEGKKAKKSGS